VVGANNRRSKSLSDIIEGKTGRSVRTCLGKRVDYSGPLGDALVGPKLKMHQCADCPRRWAIEAVPALS